jgi:hypothetical protein
MKKVMAILITIILTTICQASELTFGFKNPSFSGVGWSTHVLSIEQLQFQREQGVTDDKTAAEKAAARAAGNTTLAKFVTNVESRIFANLSKQMVDNMFGTNCTPDDDEIPDIEECPDDGEATLPDGSIVRWIRDDTAKTITLTVIDAAGGITELIVPIGDFKF